MPSGLCSHNMAVPPPRQGPSHLPSSSMSPTGEPYSLPPEWDSGLSAFPVELYLDGNVLQTVSETLCGKQSHILVNTAPKRPSKDLKLFWIKGKKLKVLLNLDLKIKQVFQGLRKQEM